MSQQYEKGLDVRRSVLGTGAVDRSLAAVNDFNRPMDELTAEWGWSRPGIAKRAASLFWPR